MKRETVKLTRGAMQLVDENCFAAVAFSDDGAKTPSLEMLAYSGGIIKGHWYWGDLSIDLEGMSIPKKRVPILEDHMTDRKIGFATKFSKEGNQLSVVASSFVDTPESLKFRETSSQGFPYEASIYARPTQIQILAENEVADVNGYQMKGPGTIWRKCTLKEASVCTFGYDSNTKSAAMSESEEVNLEYINETAEASKLNNEEDKKGMDYIKFKTDHPDEFAKLVAEVTTGLEAKFTEEKGALEVKLAEAIAQNTKLSEENKDNASRLVALEKAEMIRAEQALKHSADAVFAEKFKDSGLPDRLSAKVRKLVDHEQFVADGKLDATAFAAAIDAELKDWSNEDGTVLGFSSTSKQVGDDNTETKLVDETAARMLKSIQ